MANMPFFKREKSRHGNDPIKLIIKKMKIMDKIPLFIQALARRLKLVKLYH